jgi:hypothetical protein
MQIAKVKVQNAKLGKENAGRADLSADAQDTAAFLFHFAL